MKTYGLTHETLAMVSVVQREWAAKNPRATFKAPITVEDVLNSRMIAYPFRLLQCCLVTDGGGALILVAAERARDFPQSLPLAVNRGPLYLLGTGESGEKPMGSQMEDFTSSRAFRVAGPKAFAEAGITHNDVDHLMIYDAPCSLPGACFAHLPIYGLEDLVPGTARRPTGLCPWAEGPRPPGDPAQHQWRRPLLHAFGHVRHVRTESVRQMRGTAPAQIPDARISVCHGVGGMFAASGRSSCQTSRLKQAPKHPRKLRRQAPTRREIDRSRWTCRLRPLAPFGVRLPNLLFACRDRQHQVLIRRARKHDVRLTGIGNIRGPRIARHFPNQGADDHHVRPGLHPMLMRCTLIRVVVAGPGIPGQHVDEADLVWRVGL